MKHRYTFLLLALAMSVVSGNASLASSNIESDEAINAHLARFASDPASVMREAPVHWDEQGQVVSEEVGLRFSRESIASGEAVAARDQERVEWMRRETQAIGASAEILPNDRPEELADNPSSMQKTLSGLERAGLRKAKLDAQPWSDDYWGIFKGVLGTRYADPRFPASTEGEPGKDWRLNHEYVLNHPVASVLASGDAKAIDALSPSEKYELLTGDLSGQLTQRMWKAGEGYYNSTGKVETWMGICHGWAPASMMMSRPAKVVTVPSADGRRSLQFYPSDTKALASLLWAKAGGSGRFVGGRCNVRDPETDANGRVINPKCFDTNPGAWHLALTHQIGVGKRSFIYDATFDYQVWNQPIYSYTYRYFNPRTLYAVNSLASATVPFAQFPNDRFRTYRSPKAVSAVGIIMDLTYMAETNPSQLRTDSPVNDAKRTVRYFYDLEIDAAGLVIGGEWYNNAHPDFMWVPKPDARAASVAEKDAQGLWDVTRALPITWQKAAAKAGKVGQPLAKIVERLIELAR